MLSDLYFQRDSNDICFKEAGCASPLMNSTLLAASDCPSHNSVLGPLIIVDQSDLRDSDTMMESATTADPQLK